MENRFIDVSGFKKSVNYWWVTLLLGIAILIMGVVVFMHPGESYLALSIIFGILILLSGIVQIVVAAGSYKSPGWGWLLASGIIETILGIILAFNVGVSALVLPLFLGFWLLFRGISIIGIAADMRSYGIKGTGWTIAWAVLLLICSILVIIFPAIGVGAIVIWLGLSFVVGGVAMIFFSMHLLSLRKHLKA